MNKYAVPVAFVITMSIFGCSKKTIPTSTVTPTTDIKDSVRVVVKSDTLVTIKSVIKPAVKRKPKEATPKVITVNDKYAKKSVDGRYYYDLQGHRYWRNNKDGKYYLFNKSMLTDEAFKKPN